MVSMFPSSLQLLPEYCRTAHDKPHTLTDRHGWGGMGKRGDGRWGHLDSRWVQHHDANVRTTVTLEKDVERMLRDAMHRSRKSFKETLNAAVRTGLGGQEVRSRAKRFVVKARPMGLRAGVDPAGLNKLPDDLEVDVFQEKHARGRQS